MYSHPTELLSVLKADKEGYVSQVAQVLSSSFTAPSRALLRSHLNFLTNHFYPSLHGSEDIEVQGLKNRIIHEILFPHLLFSKPRQKSVALVWEVIEASEKEGQAVGNTISHHEFIAGCVEAVRWEEAKAKGDQQPTEEEVGSSYDATKTMADVNIALASKIAGTC